MQAVPSLIGTGTAVAAVAAGLVFGQPTEPISPRPMSHKRKLTAEFDNSPAPLVDPGSRPGTSSAVNTAQDDSMTPQSADLPLQAMGSATINIARLPRSGIPQVTPPKASSRRHSFIRPSEWAPPPISEVSRDSLSSNGSWMRRLSIRPLSQHGSPRSSVALDYPSLTFSHGSAAPILSPSSLPPQQQRNRLVKRTTTGQDGNTSRGTLSRRGSRSQMPTLRRPATSHQRSATLQQQIQHPITVTPPAPVPKYSLDQQIRPSVMRLPVEPSEKPEQREPSRTWSSFFHSRITKATSRSTPIRSTESSPSNYPLPNRRIHIRQGSVPRAYLITTAMMAAKPSPQTEVNSSAAARFESGGAAHVVDHPNPTPEETPSKRARRSISMHFSSPSNWISRTGSIRRPKRGADSKSGGQRHVSAPVGNPHSVAQKDLRQAVEDILTAPAHRQDAEGFVSGESRSRQRNSSSPLPPLSRLSSFHVDLSRLGASAATGHKSQPSQGNDFPASQGHPYPPHSRDVSNERASTLAGSDLEMRGFVSGDDDDTDFKSDTMFDSVRTAGSGRLRTVETPLESMFDESPPSTAGNSKTKRLSIQEILGRSWDGDTKIMEEDEGVPTPIRGAQSSHGDVEFSSQNPDIEGTMDFEQPTANYGLANRDFGRLSLDEDDDEDWARMEENGLTNHLSPPSSSVNSRGVSPNIRSALASISGNGSPESTHRESRERPRSNVFDWSEPAMPDKMEMDGQSPRPKTVHGKQELDLRGGRPPNRKGPAAAHVRSQSVPVIPDPSEVSKSASKFGTWASGPKNASEDWDDDFDFEVGAAPSSSHGKEPASALSMVVPASIQATQPTVKAHSGQIRELSLLVNGLKRLCRHGRDLDILDESASLWKEAENIIALASPDEEGEDDDADDDTDDDGDSMDFDPTRVDERYVDEGFDARTLDSFEDPFETAGPEMPKTAVVRERQVARRRSVFSPEDDIFGGNWPLAAEEKSKVGRPQTPDRSKTSDGPDSAMIASIMEAMQQQRSSSAPIRPSPMKPSKSDLFFNTNTLQELVKRANTLFHTLSEIVRRAELITQSPACTPRHQRHHRHDGSPAFTRVFTDPSSPPKRLPKSQSTNSVLGRTSIDAPASGGMGQRFHMMIVN